MGAAWFVNPVGGAVITGNSFTNSTQYIRARGDYDNSQFDWASYWNDNTFDKRCRRPRDGDALRRPLVRYDVFTNIRRIGGRHPGEVGHAVAGDTMLAKAGSYPEQVTINKPSRSRAPAPVSPSCTGAGADNGIGITAGYRRREHLRAHRAGLRQRHRTGARWRRSCGPGVRRTSTSIGNDMHGLFLPGAALDNVTLNVVNASDNGVAGSGGRGIWFIDDVKTNISIIDGHFNNNALVGIDINDGSVTGLTITGNEVVGNGDSGIGVLGAQGPAPT